MSVILGVAVCSEKLKGDQVIYDNSDYAILMNKEKNVDINKCY